MTGPQIPDAAVHACIEAWYAHAGTHAAGEEEPCCARAGLAAAYPILAEQIRRELDGGPDHHVIDLREDGWTIRHPLSCRPNLFDCEVNRVAAWAVLPGNVGEFPCRLSDDGQSLIIDIPVGSDGSL